MKMNDELRIPQVGLGLWNIKGQSEMANAYNWALEAGYRLFDSAQAYGNEEVLGRAVSAGKVPREEVFITTKISTSNMGHGLPESFDESLKKLRMDYVDLLLLHFPMTITRRISWPLMEQIYASGRAKSIGVSNYTIKHLEELLAGCKVKPAVNQVELSVFLQQPELLDFCKQQGIVVEAYSPLTRSQRVNDPVLVEIAKKHDKTPAQVMIRWCIEAGTVPIPKSSHHDRIIENIGVFDFELDADDMKQIAGLEEDFRTGWDPTHVE